MNSLRGTLEKKYLMAKHKHESNFNSNVPEDLGQNLSSLTGEGEVYPKYGHYKLTLVWGS